MLVRRDEDAIALGNARGADNKLRYPSVRPFSFPHRAIKWKDCGRRGIQFLPISVSRTIWFGNVHGTRSSPLEINPNDFGLV